MAKKSKKAGKKGSSGKSSFQKRAESEIKDAAVAGTPEDKGKAEEKADIGENKGAKSAGDEAAKAPDKEPSAPKKDKGRAETGEEKPAFSTHLHDYDIGQPKPETWEKPETVEIPGGAKINVTLYFGRFGDAKNLDDEGNEAPFERKSERTKWLAAQKEAWRRTQGGTALRQKCRGRLRAVISKVKYIGLHQGVVITEDQNKKLARAQELLEDVYNGINSKGILIDPKTGDVLDHELNKIAQAADSKAS